MIRPLVRIVESLHDREVRFAASATAVKLGARVEIWQAWCEIIPQDDVNAEAITQLILGTMDLPFGETRSSGSLTRSQCYVVRDAWRTFLNKNRAVLESGKRVSPDDPSVTPALTGLNFSDSPAATVELKDGTVWPPRPK